MIDKIDDLDWVWRMDRLTRDVTAESVSRDQILRRERGQGKQVDPYSAISEDHTYTHVYTFTYSFLATNYLDCLFAMERGTLTAGTFNMPTSYQ